MSWRRLGFILLLTLSCGIIATELWTSRHRGKESIVRDLPVLVASTHFAEQLDVKVFSRGSVHSHSARSDGTDSAAAVIAWYRRNDYRFLALTDHNLHFDPAKYSYAERPRFLLVAGEEVSLAAEGLAVHVNGLCTHRTIGFKRFDDRVAAANFAIDEIHRQGGVAIVNHPNFFWTFNASHLKRLRGSYLLELISGHHRSKSNGDARHPSVEAKWEGLLQAGMNVGVVGVDDMHSLRTTKDGKPTALPGTAWVEVFDDVYSADEVCEALRRRRFYATQGPLFRRIVLRENVFRVELSEPKTRVQFIGPNARVLQEGPLVKRDEHEGDGGDVAYVASYESTGDESWVRARLLAPNGKRAWTQAYRLSTRYRQAPRR